MLTLRVSEVVFPPTDKSLDNVALSVTDNVPVISTGPVIVAPTEVILIPSLNVAKVLNVEAPSTDKVFFITTLSLNVATLLAVNKLLNIALPLEVNVPLTVWSPLAVMLPWNTELPATLKWFKLD